MATIIFILWIALTIIVVKYVFHRGSKKKKVEKQDEKFWLGLLPFEDIDHVINKNVVKVDLSKFNIYKDTVPKLIIPIERTEIFKSLKAEKENLDISKYHLLMSFSVTKSVEYDLEREIGQHNPDSKIVLYKLQHAIKCSEEIKIYII